jgi:hypothetical protein
MNFNLFMLGDDHEGNTFRYEEGVDMALNMLHDPWGGLQAKHNWMMHHGDPTESIFWNDDRRYDQDSHKFKDTMFSQVDRVVKKYSPHRSKMLLMMDGNHGNCANTRPIGNPNLEVANRLELPFGTYACISTYLYRNRPIFRHFSGHGWGFINSRVKPYKRAKVNMEIQLRSLLEQKASNCMLSSMGHTHKLVVYEPDEQLFMEARGGRIYAGHSSPLGYYGDVQFIPGDLRWYVNTGSMVKLNDIDSQANTGDWTSNSIHRSGYAERSGYDPIDIGFAIAEIRDGMISDIKKVAVDAHQGIKILR